ncbi:MAG: hypothetical protein AB7I04_18400 [Pseudomonadales bacterium]
MIFGGNSYIVLMVAGPLLGVLGTFVGQWFTAKTQRRTASGTVETSQAGELWQNLQKQVDRLEAELKEYRQENAELRRENERLKDQLHAFELELTRLRSGAALAATQPVRVTVEAPRIAPGHDDMPPASNIEGGHD